MTRLGIREWLAVGRVFAHGNLLRNGGGLRACARFETGLATFTGAGNALALSSGTAGLICALQACGIGPGDEVLVPAYTWMASAGAVLIVGAMPVFVEVDDTLTMDVADMAAKITGRSRAVIPVHMINRPCDMDAILQIASEKGLLVIEDACQAVGVRYKGRYCGTMGDIGVFSFNQFKNMTCGEGGAILTDDPVLFARALNAHDMGISYRAHGINDNTPTFLGSNYRISEIQGAILGVQLSRLPGTLRRMHRRVAILGKALADKGHTIARHHDPDDALSLAITFDSEQEAAEFAKRRGARRLFDNSKHVYTQWHPILERRMPHPGLNPWNLAGHTESEACDACPRTLDLLRRSCAINPMTRVPLPAVHMLAQKLAG